MKRSAIFIPAALIFIIVSSIYTYQNKENNELKLFSELKWTPLNPLRGDKSPQAVDLWGDRTQSGPSGFLVKFNKGFSSPPHIHNVTYQGLVLNGLIYNGDPNNKSKKWLPPLSFWTQPAGGVHITEAKGDENIAYIEIENGPYLVKSPSESFNNGQESRDINLFNVDWYNASEIGWSGQENKIQVFTLFGMPNTKQPSANLVKLPSKFSGSIRNNDFDMQIIVLKGEVEYKQHILNAGSYFKAKNKSLHSIKNIGESIVYIRTSGNLIIEPI